MLVPFYPGDGTNTLINVSYINDLPRDPDGYCAFCHGDPCAENSDESTHIAAYFARNPTATTCPCCKGKAS